MGGRRSVCPIVPKENRPVRFGTLEPGGAGAQSCQRLRSILQRLRHPTFLQIGRTVSGASCPA